MLNFDLKLKRISYIVNNKCNLYCKHCFQNARNRHSEELSESNAFLATKFAIDNNTSLNKNIEITIIGGEPTLYSDFSKLKSSFEYIFSNNYKIKILRIFTNGTIYNQSLIDLLSMIPKENIVFYITKDLLEDKPDRINYEGKSQNNLISKNINILKSNGFYVVEQYIFTKQNVKYYKDILNNIYNSDINLSFGYPCEAINDLNKENFDFMIDTFLEFIKDKNVDFDFYKRSGMELLFDLIHNDWYTNNVNKIFCDPIKGEFSISPKGYIIPCVKLLEKEDYYEELKIENIIKNPDLLYTNKKVLRVINFIDKNENNYECGKCFMKRYCVDCRLFPTLINTDNEHIEHSNQQCNRLITFYDCILNKIKEHNLWQLF